MQVSISWRIQTWAEGEACTEEGLGRTDSASESEKVKDQDDGSEEGVGPWSEVTQLLSELEVLLESVFVI